MKTIFHNGCFHTMEGPLSVVRSITADNGVILATDEDPATSDAYQVDLGGMHVWPALVESQMHMLDSVALNYVGEAMCEATAAGIEPHNLAGVERKIRKEASGFRKRDMISFNGYIVAAMDEKRLPTRQELDAWGKGAPVWVRAIDCPACSCSSALLAGIGQQDQWPDGIMEGPDYGANERMLASYAATKLDPNAMSYGLVSICNEAARYGICTICAMEGNDYLRRDNIFESFVAAAIHLPLNIRLFPQYMDLNKLMPVQNLMSKRRVGGRMKWDYDGDVLSQTASFYRPFRNGSPEAAPAMEQARFMYVLHQMIQENFTISVHATGDQAIDQLMEALEILEGGRFIINGCEFPSNDAVLSLAAFKPYLTIQPGMMWVDAHGLKAYEQLLDEEILRRILPLKRLVNAGVVLCGSSDSPRQGMNPFLQMRAMRDYLREDQGISAFEALKTYTVNPGLMLDENIGMLKPGYEASFFCTSKNLLAIAPEELEDVRSEATFIRGGHYVELATDRRSLRKAFQFPRQDL